MNTTREFGSIKLTLKENGNYAATGHYGFHSNHPQGYVKQQVERTMATQLLAGEMGFLGALDYFDKTGRLNKRFRTPRRPRKCLQ